MTPFRSWVATRRLPAACVRTHCMGEQLDDGAAGLWAIKACGGVTAVQDPRGADYPDMPANALLNVPIDYCLPLTSLGSLLTKLAYEPLQDGKRAAVPDKVKIETEFAMLQ